MKPLVHPGSPFATGPEPTYKSGKVVQTTGATSVVISRIDRKDVINMNPKNIARMLFAGLVLFSVFSQAEQPAVSKLTLISNVNIFDGENDGKIYKNTI